MFYWLFLFAASLLFSTEQDEIPLPSSSEQIASYFFESQNIGGLISPLGGSLSLAKTDLISKGAQNIILSRAYIAPYIPTFFDSDPDKNEVKFYEYLIRNYRGWVFYPETFIYRLDNGQIRVADNNGLILDFSVKNGQSSLASSDFGMCNLIGETPSGKYDPRNTRISYSSDGNSIIVFSSSGSTRHYRSTYQHFCWVLDKEILPNGKVLKYVYDEKNQLILIESLDPKERYVYASLRIKGTPREGQVNFTSGSSQKASYSYELRRKNIKIKDKKLKAEYFFTAPPLLTNASSPFYRQEKLNYCDRFMLGGADSDEYLFSVENSGFENHKNKHFRVQKLFFPVGLNDASHLVYEFNYNPPSAGQKAGTTHVKNCDGTTISYSFSKNLLLDKVQYFDQQGKLKKEKVFNWNANQWLNSLEVKDTNGLLYRRSYKYDNFGNPVKETFSGDLTGKGTTDSYTIKKEFSQDGKNLLLKEETENGKITLYQYLSGTNLVTSKLVKDKNHIYVREFFEYDDCNNLIKKITDDGNQSEKENFSGLTQRLITKYHLRTAPPFLHMVEWQEEKYLDLKTNSEKLLKKIHFIYDKHGNISQEDIYGSDGKFAYSIFKKYNERGDLISETNPIGQKAVYAYDEKGRLISSKNFPGRLTTIKTYDQRGRLKEAKKKGTDGTVHSSAYKYDLNDNLIQKTDLFGNSTDYEYDPFVRKVAKTTFPAIADEQGKKITVQTTSSYNALGFEKVKIDGNGNQTFYSYNAYGSPVKIVYPDQSKESFRYYKNGKLKSQTDQEGLTVDYTYDLLNRVLLKKYFFKNKKIGEEKFSYNSFHLLSSTDKEGHLKTYSYDQAGRKIKEEFSGQITEYKYDSLDRITETCQNLTLKTCYEKDLLNRLVKEQKTDAAGTLLYKIAYGYDKDGNRNGIERFIDGQKAKETFRYDPFSRLLEYRDALGFLTKFHYRENFTNSLGQQVLQTVKTDAKGCHTLKTYDALDRKTHEEILTSDHTRCSFKEMIYDPAGNLMLQKDHIYDGNGQYLRTAGYKYIYTNLNQVKTLTCAYGSNNSRITGYTYTPSGKMLSKTLPDKTILYYSYHPLGFLGKTISSNGQIDQSFEYNKLGYLVKASDKVQKTALERKLDPLGNILEEKFSNELFIQKSYDVFNRPLSINLSGEGRVIYQYNPLFLKKVTRFSTSGQELYSHSYNKYDLNGNLLLETLAGETGQTNYNFDKNNQKTALSSPWLSQAYSFDCVGNLSSIKEDKLSCCYAYDPFNQLAEEKSSQYSAEYNFDSHYNRLKKDQEVLEINELDEVKAFGNISYECDLDGNLTTKKSPSDQWHYTYDPLNQLLAVSSEKTKLYFTYCPLGRRLSKTVFEFSSQGWQEKYTENYLYNDQEEIGSFTANGEVKELRILGGFNKGLPNPVALELSGKFLVPVLDYQGSICKLIDPVQNTLANSYNYSAFGEELLSQETVFNPWRYSSKRLDKENGMVYFGKRYLDPQLGRWLSIDPAGFQDSMNPYQYLLNNPFRYVDPNGENLLGFLLGVGEMALGGVVMATGVALEIATCGGYTFALGFHEAAGAALLTHGYAYATTQSRDISFPKNSTDIGSISSTISGVAGYVGSEVFNKQKTKDKEDDKQHKGTPGPNTAQNKQSKDAIKEIEKEIGRKLNKDDKEELHRAISKQNYGYKEVVEEGISLFRNYY